jgi:hypothetical protein
MNGKAIKPRAGTSRVTWLVSFALPIVLLAILGASHAAGEPVGEADPSEPAIQLSDEGEWEGACVELEEEDGEPAEEAGEECEAEEEEEAEDSDEAEACPLRSVNAHATEHNDRLRVTVGYTSYRGVAAKVQVGRGSTRIGTFERHLNRSGVLRFSGRLHRHHSGRLQVSVRVPSEGGYCAEEDAVLFK